MKKNITKRSIYIRIFSAFLITYMVLMIGFGVLLIHQEKKTVENELSLYNWQVNYRVENILNEYIDSDNNITDMSNLKKEFAKASVPFDMTSTEVAVFTDDYELILNTNNYWKCQYSEYIGNIEGKQTYSMVYAFIKPKDWFNDEEIKEIESYLYAIPKAEKKGDITSYSIDIKGFWVNGEMIIPDKITVKPMYADIFDENGNVISSSDKHSDNIVYVSNYENNRDLPYFEHGNILSYNNSKINNQKQDELRQMVIDPSNLINSIDEFHIKNLVERTDSLTYRYYLFMPYKSAVRVVSGQNLYSEFWTVIGRDVNIWERIAPMLRYVWISCLLIFIIAAYVLSRQTFKINLKREELERHRKEITDALAHDLKTPLSIISGYAQNLEEDVHSEKRDHYTCHIQKNVERMDKIIHEMLDMTKLESDSLKVRFEELSLHDISIGIINRYKNICDEKSIATSLVGKSVIKGDRALLERVIDNFFINAIDNINEGGKIHIEILNDTFGLYNSGNHIQEDIIDDIWLPYKKGNTERSNTKGTGLGLSIARSILELHKFSYGVKNKEDGVVFWFKFK